MKQYNNPILPGFYPDPSICRVNDDYYLVTSSFEYFPGVPIFHSKDLVHWNQIGHVLDRPSQLDLDEINCSDGIYAPTIRYNNGIYFMITTIVGVAAPKSNFLVTSTTPEGPWSDPVWLYDAPGIDPSMFFDDDGKVYCTGNMTPQNGEKYDGHREIWIREFDVDTLSFVGEMHSIVDEGALHLAEHVEASHIYKKDGYYYLMVAEGGTFYYHSTSIFRSKNIFGKYEINPGNPIFTHRHLGRSYPIINAGHADLVETQNGDWWMILLASRPFGGNFKNLGRETFLAPVIWEEGWPIVCPMTGKLEFVCDSPDLEEFYPPKPQACDNFDDDFLPYQYNFIRTPKDKFWSLSQRKGHLRIFLKSESIKDLANPSFIGRRLQHINYCVRTAIEFTPHTDNESCGIVILQNNNYNFSLEIVIDNQNKFVKLTKRDNGQESVIAQTLIACEKVYLMVNANGQDYSFYYGESATNMILLISGVDGRILSSEVAGGFVGAYIGMYASSNGQKSENHADFDWFEYVGLS